MSWDEIKAELDRLASMRANLRPVDEVLAKAAPRAPRPAGARTLDPQTGMEKVTRSQPVENTPPFRGQKLTRVPGAAELRGWWNKNEQ